MELLTVSSAMFSLGVLHALEPAHGKVFLGGYLGNALSRKRDIVAAGIIIALLQTLCLILLGSIVAYGAKQFLNLNHLDHIVDQISAVALMVMGVLMLVHQWHHQHKQTPCCSHSHQQPSEPISFARLKEIAFTALIWGLLPCPIAITALMTGFSQHHMAVTVLSLLGFALGIASIVVSSGLCWMYGTHFMAHRLSQFSRWVPVLSVGLAITMIGVGLALLLIH